MNNKFEMKIHDVILYWFVIEYKYDIYSVHYKQNDHDRVICLQEIMGVEYFVSLYMYINIVSIRYKQDSIVKR